MTGLINEWMTGLMNEWMTGLINEWMNVQQYEFKGEWMNKWINECKDSCTYIMDALMNN